METVSERPDPRIRSAGPGDAEEIARLLHDFNTEYEEPTPGPKFIAERVAELLGGGETKVLLAGDPPAGLAVLRFRRSLWSPGLECYLAELYVAPDRRGQGLGRALMDAVIDLARAEGADYIDLNTAVEDRAARSLYESLGFDNRGGHPDDPGAANLYYELEL